MYVGATTENGPLTLFKIKEACSTEDTAGCDYTKQFSKNPNAWNAHANVLYLDQPRYVGYSFGYGDKIHSSVEAAQDFVTFYNSWLDLFPQFKGRDLIIAGESYGIEFYICVSCINVSGFIGGHYVPAWAGAIMDFNAQVSCSTYVKWLYIINSSSRMIKQVKFLSLALSLVMGQSTTRCKITTNMSSFYTMKT